MHWPQILIILLKKISLENVKHFETFHSVFNLALKFAALISVFFILVSSMAFFMQKIKLLLKDRSNTFYTIVVGLKQLRS